MAYMHKRKAELARLAKACDSQTEIARRMNVALPTVIGAAERYGIPLPKGKRGRAKGFGEKPNSRRIISMIARRKNGATYQEIGEEFGITRERVRQVLWRVRPDLCGGRIGLGLAKRAEPSETVHCAHCGRPKRVWPAHVRQRENHYCGYACMSSDRRDGRTAQAYKLRMQGLTWQAVGALIWPDAKQPATYAIMAVHRHGEYTGADVSDAFGRHGK